MARNNQSGRGNRGGGNRGRNNNPEGRNQYSGGFTDYARERPVTAAVTAAAAVGAGVFLWSRRSQISEQISSLSDQISDWTGTMRSSDQGSEFDDATEAAAFPTSSSKPTSSRPSRKSQREIAEEALTLKETGAA